mmetsp:Transcript_47560/g.126096  ORF Transcript_47560/g.126096 Transcript_47560/m.126096 type:complete len:105 (-) Transcript_47560:516-830(-)
METGRRSLVVVCGARLWYAAPGSAPGGGEGGGGRSEWCSKRNSGGGARRCSLRSRSQGLALRGADGGRADRTTAEGGGSGGRRAARPCERGLLPALAQRGEASP